MEIEGSAFPGVPAATQLDRSIGSQRVAADTPVVWWLFPSVIAVGLGLLVARTVRLDAAEQGAEMQRRCETHCLTAGLGHGTAEPKADACVCEQGGSQP